MADDSLDVVGALDWLQNRTEIYLSHVRQQLGYIGSKSNWTSHDEQYYAELEAWEAQGEYALNVIAQIRMKIL
jgi:hypothetical protein